MALSVIVMKKEAGLTSFQSLRPVKMACKGQKVGHTGTLDKFASGLMVVLTGEATRLNPLFSGFDKSYRAEVLFGCETSTLDPEGEVIRTSDHIPTLEEIEAVIPRFLGLQKQTPPIYSAVHVDGQRAYRAARKGEEVEMPERDINIYDLSVISYEAPRLVIDVSVSKGTYIRSLARDLGMALSSAAHLTALERYKVGPFSYSSLTGIPASAEESEDALSLVTKGGLEVRRSSLKRIRNGSINQGCISSRTAEGSGYYMLYCCGSFIGVAEETVGGALSVRALVSREDL